MSSIPDSSPSTDRRSEARMSPGDVGCFIEGLQIVHVLGLSHGGHGMRVMTNKPLPRDQDLAITLDLDGKEVSVTGRWVWEKDEDLQFTHRYITGVHFVEGQHEPCSAIAGFLEARLERAASSTAQA